MSKVVSTGVTAATADLGFARLDLDRAARTGDPEVVFGAGKTPEQIAAALARLHEAHPDRAVLATRVGGEGRSLCRDRLPGADIDDAGRTVTLGAVPPPRGKVAVVCAGTSDLPVARECATTVAVFGAEPDLVVDVGVAGLHRLLAERDRIDDRRRDRRRRRHGGRTAVRARRPVRRPADRGAHQRRLRLAPGRAHRPAGLAQHLRRRRGDGQHRQRFRRGGRRRPHRPARRARPPDRRAGSTPATAAPATCCWPP